MDNWKRKRISKALRNLKKSLPMADDIDALSDRI